MTVALANRSDAYQRELAANRARKEHYRGTCENCGRPTTGCNGPGKAPRFCAKCTGPMRATRTPGAIITAIQAWAERFGRPPTATDWNPSWAKWYARKHPTRPSSARLLATASIVVDEDWPRTNTVVWRFGSWNAALKAAGFAPLGPAGRRVPTEVA